MSRTDSHPALLERLLRAVNAHDLDTLVSTLETISVSALSTLTDPR